MKVNKFLGLVALGLLLLGSPWTALAATSKCPNSTLPAYETTMCEDIKIGPNAGPEVNGTSFIDYVYLDPAKDAHSLEVAKNLTECINVLRYQRKQLRDEIRFKVFRTFPSCKMYTYRVMRFQLFDIRNSTVKRTFVPLNRKVTQCENNRYPSSFGILEGIAIFNDPRFISFSGCGPNCPEVKPENIKLKYELLFDNRNRRYKESCDFVILQGCYYNRGKCRFYKSEPTDTPTTV